MGEAGSDKVSVCSRRTWSLANPEPVSVQGPPRQRAGSGMGCSLLPQNPSLPTGELQLLVSHTPHFPSRVLGSAGMGRGNVEPRAAQLLLMPGSHTSLLGL